MPENLFYEKVYDITLTSYIKIGMQMTEMEIEIIYNHIYFSSIMKILTHISTDNNSSGIVLMPASPVMGHW